MPAFDYLPGHSYLRGRFGGAVHKALFSSPSMPSSQAPVVMPTENTAAIAQAQQAQAAQASAGSGRAATILMQNMGGSTDKMGG